MWDNNKRHRFNELREPDRILNSAEETELEVLVKELEDAEAAYLAPATERMRREADETAKCNAELEDLIKRKEALVQRLQNVLAETRSEQQAIANEFATVLADNPEIDSDE